MSDQPMSATPAVFPPDYGSRGGEGNEAFERVHVEQRLRDAPNDWVATVTTDGRPHTRPVDSVWVDGALCFGAEPVGGQFRSLEPHRGSSSSFPSTTFGGGVLVEDPPKRSS